MSLVDHPAKAIYLAHSTPSALRMSRRSSWTKIGKPAIDNV